MIYFYSFSVYDGSLRYEGGEVNDYHPVQLDLSILYSRKWKGLKLSHFRLHDRLVQVWISMLVYVTYSINHTYLE